mmetsp:Transcript_55922/g.103485  ORF Transcript_55922/g.103485 Transcript_55922/m.103485 type:complete len:258 (-) Transcript_55922:32-805(-)
MGVGAAGCIQTCCHDDKGKPVMPVNDTGNEYEVSAPAVAKQADLRVVPAPGPPSQPKDVNGKEAKLWDPNQGNTVVPMPAAVVAKESAKVPPLSLPPKDSPRDPPKDQSQRPQDKFEEMSSGSRNPVPPLGTQSYTDAAKEAQVDAAAEDHAGEFIFKEDDVERTIVFTQAPLGMKFDKHKMPIVIRAFTRNSYAQAAGVRPGMELIRVEGTDITQLSYDQAFAIITAAARRISDRTTGPLQQSTTSSSIRTNGERI